MKPEQLTLDGCAPTPLASYLKALGVLRLLSSGTNNVTGESVDPQVRGWWEGERFHLRTTLGREGVMRFFLHDYAPSPIIAPWNGRAGFLEGDENSNREGAVLMRQIESGSADRLRRTRSTIHLLRANDDVKHLDGLRAKSKALARKAKALTGVAKQDCLDAKREVDATAKRIKATLLPSLRSVIAREHVEYLDSCFVVSTAAGSSRAAPILGAGGVDGSRDFGVRFAAELVRAFDFETGQPRSRSETYLRSALFGTPARLDKIGAMGMFSPGDTGPNATVGFKGRNPLNHWDLILAMEGTVVFAGALTRRWDSTGSHGAAFPFTFEPTQAGSGVFAAEDPNRPRGEVWTPLWGKPVSYAELRAVFSEGRLTMTGGVVKTGLDAARSMSQLGVSRGISGFERYSLIQPAANLPYQATPLGRIATPRTPMADIIGDLDQVDWLRKAKAATTAKSAPAAARKAMGRLVSSLFEVTDPGQREVGIANSLVALGDFVAWLARSPKGCAVVDPPPLLGRSWLHGADDGTPEYRIAAALAGLGLAPPTRLEDSNSAESPTTRRAPPMAAHFAPVTNRPPAGFEGATFFRGRWLRQRRSWAGDGNPPTVVWGHGGLVANMTAVLERRLAETSIRGLADKPLAGASFAQLSDVAAFLSGDFDDARCSDLLAGMVWVQPGRLPPRETDGERGPATLPFAYAALKPIFFTDEALVRVNAIPSEASMPISPGLVGQLRAGGRALDGRAIDQAVRTALSRARSSGLPSPYDSIQSRGGSSTLHSGRIGVGIRPDRLAAAMLIPISDRGLASLLGRAYPGAVPDESIHPTKETKNVD